MNEEKKGFRLGAKEEVHVLSPDELTELKQLMKTNILPIIQPHMTYVVPGQLLSKLFNQIGLLATQLDEQKKTQELKEDKND